MTATTEAADRASGHIDVAALPLQLVQLRRTDSLLALHAVARDLTASQADFVGASRRIIRLLLEEALGVLTHDDHQVTTPLGQTFHGRRARGGQVVAVSVPRAGDAMEAELRDIVPGASVGKILIQRDPTTKLPKLFYSKLPRDVAGREVLLLDPMMATGGTVGLAVEVLQHAGVAVEDIVLVNFLTCPEALEGLSRRCPGMRVVTGFVDDGLTAEAFMSPGIGDFGDRFYGTLA